MISCEEFCHDVPGIIHEVQHGSVVVLQEANAPVVAIIAYEDYLALREQLAQRHAAKVTQTDWERTATEVLNKYDEAWKRLADL